MTEPRQGQVDGVGGSECEQLTPDIHALVATANDLSNSQRLKRQLEAGAHGEATRIRDRRHAQMRDRTTSAAFIVLIAALWGTAAVVFYAEFDLREQPAIAGYPRPIWRGATAGPSQDVPAQQTYGAFSP